MNERPCSIAEAMSRMRSMVGLDYPYQLGTGNFTKSGPPQGPWDCVGAAMCEAYKVTRHRPGFARGVLPPEWRKFADVVDDINSNSMIKDALLNQELLRFVPEGEPLAGGDILAYPTIVIVDADDGDVHRFTGHAQFVDDPKGAVSGGPYSDVWILHAHGGNGRRPAVTRNKAYVMDQHNHVWPKPIHKAWALRVVP